MLRFQSISGCAIAGVVAALSLLAGCAPPGPVLRVATWNVHACRAGLAEVAEQIASLDADVVCLQEVESGLLESPEVNQAARLAEMLGMHAVFAPEPKLGTQHEQLAILARGPLYDVELLEKNGKRQTAPGYA